jgi:ATP-dependent DNA ligase
MIRPFLPMLAVASEPFDSSEYLFEVKWDGVRALACVQDDRCRIWGRELADYTDRYPELDVLSRLPSGTVLDGELVVLRDGRADLSAILRRHHLASARKIQLASRHLPVTYVLFDCLYHKAVPCLTSLLPRGARYWQNCTTTWAAFPWRFPMAWSVVAGRSLRKSSSRGTKA